jgi:hypothetical protein
MTVITLKFLCSLNYLQHTYIDTIDYIVYMIYAYGLTKSDQWVGPTTGPGSTTK